MRVHCTLSFNMSVCVFISLSLSLPISPLQTLSPPQALRQKVTIIIEMCEWWELSAPKNQNLKCTINSKVGMGKGGTALGG